MGEYFLIININTLEGSFYSNLKNDISFLLDGIIIVLIEHQTTINPNMPLRFLSYLDELYRRLTSSQSAKIYGSVLIKVPAPEFYVFYDGDDISFDHKLLKLSDAFETPSEKRDTITYIGNPRVTPLRFSTNLIGHLAIVQAQDNIP